MTLTVEIEQEKDGRWIAEIPQIPGTMAYGRTRTEAVSRVEALALRVLAERIDMVNLRQSSKKSFRLQPHEPMRLRKGSQGFGGVAAHRLDNQTRVSRVASNSLPS
jgi:predicted RNase H-like HicB family nuclease